MSNANSNVSTIQNHLPQAQSNSSYTRVILAAVMGIYILVCYASCFYINHSIDLTATYSRLMSWLISPSTSLYLFAGSICGVVGVVILSLSLIFLIVSKFTPAFVGFVLLLVLWGADYKALTERIGILSGQITIGCYVYSMKECHKMLNLSETGLKSRFDDEGRDADWYLQKLSRESNGDKQSWLHAWFNMPGSALLSAPWYLKDVASANSRITKQRITLSQYIKSQTQVTP